MGKLIISENTTLDGVVEDPTGDDGTEHGGWFTQHMRDAREAWADAEFAEARQAAALLLGRRSDQYFGPRWNSAPGEWADHSRSLPKYVVTSTTDAPVWVNSTVLRGDVVPAVRDLKTRVDGDIITYASRQLVHTLLAHDLVDEVHLMVFPVVVGAGRRLFEDRETATALRLRSVEQVGADIVRIVYGVARD